MSSQSQSWWIALKKHLLRKKIERLYGYYHAKDEDFASGVEVAERLYPRYYITRMRFNHAVRKLRELDPQCPPYSL